MDPPSQRPERPDFPFFQSPSPLKIGVFAANFGEIGSFGENVSLGQIAHLFPVFGVQNCIFFHFLPQVAGAVVGFRKTYHSAKSPICVLFWVFKIAFFSFFSASCRGCGGIWENLSLAQIADLFPVLGVQISIFSFFCREWPGLIFSTRTTR